ncbi:MAG: virulence protein RhuM/Fic/DOC family protein [Pyrinomonadaceae bacterium]
MEENKSEIILYQANDGQTKIDVRLENETVWLTQKQMAEMFEVDVRTVNEYAKNIFKSGELEKNATIRKFRTVQKEGERSEIRRTRVFKAFWAIVQTFGGDCLYPSIEEQAAHLLYFVIKSHPFTDGNKRIGSFLFVWFLEKNKHRFDRSGRLKINENALIALALLVAQSDPADKDLMIKLIINLISDEK